MGIFTAEELRDIAAGALFLKERLRMEPAHAAGIDEEEGSIVEKRYERWKKKAGGNGGEAAFLKRLALEGLSPEQAKTSLRPLRWPEGTPLPEWVRELEKVCSLLPAQKEDFAGKLKYQPAHESAERADATEALLPFLYYAEQQTIAGLKDNVRFFYDAAIGDLSRALARALNQLCMKTCFFRFQQMMHEQNPLFALFGTLVSREEQMARWRGFMRELLAGEWKEILHAYPVLARLMMGIISNWIRNFLQFAKDLEADQAQLEAVFRDGKPLGKLTAIEADVSDPHHHGKTVLLLTFQSGLKLVYKPRSLAIDAAWRDWLHGLEAEGLPYPLKTSKVVDEGDHGWMEFIEHLPLERREEAAAFYFRAGVLLGSIYVLGGNDFHCENLIACGAHPVLIDTESLLLHRVKPFDNVKGRNAAQKVYDVLSDSVLRTGMLPLWIKNAKGEALDWGALTGQDKGKHNLPVFEGKPLDVKDYQEQLLEGFAWVYDLAVRKKQQLLGESSPLNGFAACLFRFMIRSSQVYGDVLEHTARPEFLRDGLSYSFEVERIASAYLLSAPDSGLKELWNIFLSERDALENRDIPAFYGKARELGLTDGTRTLHAGYFMESAIDRAQSLIRRMDEQDKNVQIDLIRTALSMHGETSHGTSKRSTAIVSNVSALTVTDDLLLEEAMNIYDAIMSRKIAGADGDFTWIVRHFDLQTQKMTLGRIGIGLYDGLIGLGVFMAALYHVTKREEIRQTALQAIQSFRESLRAAFNPLPVRRFPLGMGNGLAGIVRGLTVMADYLEETSLHEDALHIVRQIQAEQIDQDRLLDLLGGSAGLLLVLVDLYQSGKDDAFLALARRCGNHLLKTRVRAASGHQVWKTQMAKAPLTGMGHGAAGYAAALYRLAMITQESAFLQAALEALDYENHLYDEQHNNWPDLRSNPYEANRREKAFMAGWCSGAPGIGLSRMSMLAAGGKQEDISGMKQDIERAVRFAQSFPDAQSDHLCCGHGGRIDLLIEASLHFNRGDWMEDARKKAGMIIARKRQIGHYLLNGSDEGAVFNPSFFQGISGIGYTLLRCIAPTRMRSLLT